MQYQITFEAGVVEEENESTICELQVWHQWGKMLQNTSHPQIFTISLSLHRAKFLSSICIYSLQLNSLKCQCRMTLTSSFLSNFPGKPECLQINSRLITELPQWRKKCWSRLPFFFFFSGGGDEGRRKTFDLAWSKSAYFTHISNQPPKTVPGFEHVEQEAI